MLFKKFNQKTEFDLVEYVGQYLEKHDGVELLVGCDSQNHGDKTVYAVVVALYHTGHGAHVIYRRWKTEKEYTRAIRLLNEVWFAVEAAELLRKAGLPKVKYIDIDLNPDPKFKSNEVFRQAVGLVEGMGYEARYKTLGPLMTYMADYLVKA